MPKKKILMLCDHPLVPSGVGTQARYLIEGLLATGKYKFHVWGGAIKHPNYAIQRVEPEKYGDDWIVTPVDGYGDKDRLRETIRAERPDALLLFTDPRFFTWVWEMEDEVRAVCPILYWHVWDNDPTPVYNRVFYDSTDHIVALSLKTAGLLKDMGYTRTSYIPHAVSPDIFRPLPEQDVAQFRREFFGPHADKEFVLFWNNRNARRKMTGDVVASFAKFMKKIPRGKDRVALCMHTSVLDPEGQNILEVAKCYGADANLIISEQRVDAQVMNLFYNACDTTINIANNEGFGLGTLESLMAGTPIVVSMTGGLQFQVGGWWQSPDGKLVDGLIEDQDEMTSLAKSMWGGGKDRWERFFGVPIFPASRSCTGSQQIPYIYDDRVAHDDVVDGLERLFLMGRERRKALGLRGSAWARKTFDLKTMVSDWDRVLQEQIGRFAQGPGQGVRSVTI